MENSNKNQDQNRQNQNVRPGQAGQSTPETKDFSKGREGQYSNDSSRRQGSESEIKNSGQNQGSRDESLRH